MAGLEEKSSIFTYSWMTIVTPMNLASTWAERSLDAPGSYAMVPARRATVLTAKEITKGLPHAKNIRPDSTIRPDGPGNPFPIVILAFCVIKT